MADRKIKEREFLLECIQLYREFPTLWNIKSTEYHDREKKNHAYEILLSKYKEMFPEATKDEVKKKFNSLRTNYRKELNKNLQSMKSGSSTDDIYQPTLWYYKEMIFLQDQESASDSQSSMDAQCTERSVEGDTENITTQDSAITEDDQISSNLNKVPGPKSKKNRKKNEDELLELAIKRLKHKSDEYENWALGLAADLKKMEPLQQIFAKKAIGDIVMEGQLGLLHRNSVKINGPTISSIITPKTSMSTPTYYSSTPTPTHYSSTPSPQYVTEQQHHNQETMAYSLQNEQDESLAQYLKFN